MTEQGADEAGAGADKPAPGFTFANKRKINTEGSTASTQGVSEPAVEDTVEGELIDDTPTVEVDANEQLAAERLMDLQRLQAEYANYRKRMDRDRAAARELTIGSVVESLLPVLDDIALARQHGDLESGPFASIAEKLETALGKYGVERFGEPGAPFDPAIHDALMHVEAELAEGTQGTTVVAVLQPGYKIGERIVRPARVSVADPQ